MPGETQFMQRVLGMEVRGSVCAKVKALPIELHPNLTLDSFCLNMKNDLCL